MELIILCSLVGLFLILLGVTYFRESAPTLVFALIIAIILAAMVYSSGIEYKVGTNATLSADNRTITTEDSYKPIKSSFSVGIAFVFFMLAIWLVSVLIGGKS